MPHNPLISVIICTYNRDKFLPLALESFENQVFPADKWELIIVDNNCSDNTATICKQFIERNGNLNTRYILETKQGLSHARNRGIRKSRGQYLAFVDDDAVARPDYLSHVQSFFDKTPGASLVGGRISPRFEGKKPAWVSSFLMPLFSILDLGEAPKQLTGKVYPVGANMIFKSVVFEQCGAFNTSLGRVGKNMMGGEEKDMYLRVVKHGGQIYYAPGPVVHHIIPVDRATEQFIRKQAIGVGMSEKARVAGNTVEQAKSSLREMAKWCATLALVVCFSLAAKPSRAIMLLKFRAWVSKGLWCKNS